MKKSAVDLEDAAARAEAPLMARYPLARAFDLFALQDTAREAWPRTTAPALVAASVHDHVVDFGAVEALRHARPGVRFVRLQRGFHQLCRDRDRALVIAEAAAFVDEVAGAPRLRAE